MADNLNISPDMIENLVNMLNNSNISSNTNTDAKNSDSSFNTTSNTSNKNVSNSTFNLENLDIETIMKIKSIMETLNASNDQDSNLLYSLKPYLRKSRQAKLDQYINILKISQISKLFKKGDAN